MDDKEFNALADGILASIEAALEASGADIDFELAAGGVLEIEFADGSKIIVNTQPPLHEVWMAARAGGCHYRWVDGRWLDTRDGSEFLASLSRQASAQAGLPLQF